MPDSFEKPRTSHLSLKPRVVVPTDPPAKPGDGSAISVGKIHEQNRLAEEGVAKGTLRPFAAAEAEKQELPEGFKRTDFAPLNSLGSSGGEDPVVVEAMLAHNKATETRQGLWRMKKFKRPSSRRVWEFFLIVVPIDAGVYAIMKYDPNVFTFVYGISGITLVTSTSAWMLFVVLDKH